MGDAIKREFAMEDKNAKLVDVKAEVKETCTVSLKKNLKLTNNRQQNCMGQGIFENIINPWIAQAKGEVDAKKKVFSHSNTSEDEMKLEGYPVVADVKSLVIEEDSVVFHPQYSVMAETHSKQGSLACNKCSYVSKERGNLDRHVRLVHNGIKDFTCAYCGKVFGLKQYLNNHIIRLHEKVKKHKCGVCGKSFGIKDDVKKHARKVHGFGIFCNM